MGVYQACLTYSVLVGHFPSVVLRGVPEILAVGYDVVMSSIVCSAPCTYLWLSRGLGSDLWRKGFRRQGRGVYIVGCACWRDAILMQVIRFRRRFWVGQLLGLRVVWL